MKAEKVALSTGVIKYFVYSKEDMNKKTKIKDVVLDLYKRVPDLDAKIIWIYKAVPHKGSIAKLIKEFESKEKNLFNDNLVIAQAGTLSLIPAEGDTKDALVIIEDERKNLYEAEFNNILFNRLMNNSCGNPEYFMYTGEVALEFVKNNIGGSDKIIKSFV